MTPKANPQFTPHYLFPTALMDASLDGPQGPQNAASLRRPHTTFLPQHLSPPVFSSGNDTAMHQLFGSQLPRHSLLSLSSPLSPHTIPALSDSTQNISHNTYNNSSKLLENLFVLSWYFFPCKRMEMDTLWTLGLWAELNTLGTLCLLFHLSER